MNVKTRRGRLGFVALFALIGAGMFTLLGALGPIIYDMRVPATHWIEVIDAKIISYDPITAVASYRWHRTVLRDVIVNTHLELIAKYDHEELVWSVSYNGVRYEQGEKDLIFTASHGMTEFPDLAPGTYSLEGLICFQTPHGVHKQLPFTFDDYVVREVE